MKTRSPIRTIFLLGFILTLHTALPVYVYSSFLSKISSERFVGLIYAVSSLLTIAAILTLPYWLRRFGNYRLALVVLSAELISLVALFFFKEPTLIVVSFALNFVLVAVLGINLDIFLERFSTDGKTGGLRGGFLTTINAAWLIVPVTVGLIVADANYTKPIFIAALLALPTLVMLRKLKGFSDPTYHDFPIKKTFFEVSSDKNLKAIFIASFLLQFFYSWMVIYTPLYLHGHLGLSWQNIGVIFTVMLLPFVLLERPAGLVADRRLGEKELLMVGFAVMALATAAVGAYGGRSVAVWALLLFLSRVGASLVEVMGDTYFFKKVAANRANVISLFRATRPLAMTAAPAAATVILSAATIESIFFVLAALLMLGLAAGATLKDTK